MTRSRITIVLLTAMIGFAFAGQLFASARKFSTPEKAVDAFVGAVRSYNLKALVAIFGEGSERVFASDDPVADQKVREQFLKYYDERHVLANGPNGSQVLVVGDIGWPFPIPVVKSGSKWAFDFPSGLDEIINRRVGRNELDAIQTCLAIVDAEREYYVTDHNDDGILEYAQSFRSSVGQHNGLFWPADPGQAQSPLGEFVAAAADEGYTMASNSYHGYHYKLLTSQGPNAPGGAYDYVVRGHQIGGFAVVAYPATYGDSGIMTFIVSHTGIVFQKDLGTSTEESASKMTVFDPGEGWTKVAEKDLVPIE